MPLVLQPIDQKAKAQLAQQLACWAKMDNGMTDPAVQYGTCCVSPTGQTLGRWTIPDGLCDEYGALPFTGNGGQTIVCPPTQAEIMPYYIYDSDVNPFDPNTCVQIPEPLPAVTGLAASAVTETGMTLTWAAVTGADGYAVQYSANGGATWTAVSPAPTSATVTLSGLTANTTYTIRVRATDSTGAALPGPWATITQATVAPGDEVPDLVPLETPVNLAAGTPTATEIPVTVDVVADADGYEFEYSTDGQTWTTVASESNSATLTDLTAETEYTIRVRATDSTGAFDPSDYSATITATTAAA